MRFAAIADIHGNSAALKAILKDIDHLGIAHVVNLGDCLSGPMDPAGTADLLMARAYLTIRGNHDRALIDRPVAEMALWEQWTHPHLSQAHLDWIAAMPAWCVWRDIFLCHGTPRDDTANWLDVRDDRGFLRMASRDHVEAQLGEVDQHLVLCAHTHVPRVVRIGKQMIANPGSLGCPAYLDDRKADPFIAETGLADARYAIFEQSGDDWITTFRAIPYDAGEMVARIREHGAESWVGAVATGWITPPQ